MTDPPNIATPEVDEGPGWTSRRLTAQRACVGAIVARIENIFESIVDSLSASEELELYFRPRRSSRSKGSTRPERIRFPGRTSQEALKFARVLLILQLSHDALVSGTILTKRHIFYQHQDLFKTQRVVDELVDDIAYTLGLNRDDLNIVASAKGVVSGPLKIRLHDDTLIDASLGELGTPIPPNRSIAQLEMTSVNWVLVVEKDATFRSLSSSLFWQTSARGPGLLITAKGYPDLITLAFLRMIQSSNPQMPILALVDLDPDGINIFRCYRFGSDNLAHEASVGNLKLRWLGIKTQHVLEFDIATPNLAYGSDDANSNSQSSICSQNSRGSISSTNCRDPVSQLKQRDRKAAVSTLKKLSNMGIDDVEVIELTRELQTMLMMGVKTEMQWVDEAGHMAEWLDDCMTEVVSSIRTVT